MKLSSDVNKDICPVIVNFTLFNFTILPNYADDFTYVN
jgi:hypothetical protein